VSVCAGTSRSRRDGSKDAGPAEATKARRIICSSKPNGATQMPCFLVSEDHLNRIVNIAFQQVRHLGYATPQELGEALAQMNADAYNARYRAKMQPVSYTFRKVEYARTMENFKLFQCFLYQCNEFDIFMRPLFCELQKMEPWWAYMLITQTNEYQQAAWEI
jgi:hypothetical protein